MATRGADPGNEHTPAWYAMKANQQAAKEAAKFTGGAVMNDKVKASMEGPSNEDVTTEIHFYRPRDSQEELSEEVQAKLFAQFLAKVDRPKGRYSIQADVVGGSGWMVMSTNCINPERGGRQGQYR